MGGSSSLIDNGASDDTSTWQSKCAHISLDVLDGSLPEVKSTYLTLSTA